MAGGKSQGAGRGGGGGRRGSLAAGRGGKGINSTVTNNQTASARRLSQKFFMCLTCDAPVEDNTDCVQCYECKQWCHLDCTDLTTRQFDMLTGTDSSVQWLCSQCKDGERTRRDEKDDKLDFLIRKLERLEEKLTKLELGYTGDTLDEKIDKAVERRLAEALDERSEIEKRKMNVIVVGLRESGRVGEREREEDDLKRLREMVTQIDSDLKETDIESPVRLGKKTDRPRVIKIKAKSEAAKEKILKNYHKLNEGKRLSDKINFNSDLTPLQRQKQRIMREELERKRRETGEQDWVINYRTGKIVKKRILSSEKTGESLGQGSGKEAQ